MGPIDLDATRSIRDCMVACMDANTDPEDVRRRLREAAWYSPRDRRTMRALCDAHPGEFTRWLFERERDGRYTGLVMVWPADHVTPIHDHAGLWGVEMVLQGALAVDDYALEDDAQPHFIGTTLLQEGESCAFRGTPGHAHRCMNPSSRRPAVTLQVYGGLLDTYRTFEYAGDAGYVVQQTTAQLDGSVGALRVRGP